MGRLLLDDCRNRPMADRGKSSSLCPVERVKVLLGDTSVPRTPLAGDRDNNCRVSNFVANRDIPDLPVSDCLVFVANGFVSFLWRIPDSPSRLASHAPPTS
jgi:hypothetical protein